jgi:hypothetical protein
MGLAALPRGRWKLRKSDRSGKEKEIAWDKGRLREFEIAFEGEVVTTLCHRYNYLT